MDELTPLIKRRRIELEASDIRNHLVVPSTPQEERKPPAPSASILPSVPAIQTRLSNSNGKEAKTPVEPPQRVELDVGFRERKAAKAAGAQWDPAKKLWYVLADSSAFEACSQWIKTEDGEMAKKKRVNLRVPFAEKEAVKAAGAKWDPELKVWYATNTAIAKCARWRTDKDEIAENKQDRQDAKLEFTAEQDEAFELVKSGRNIVLSSAGGTGKSTWIKMVHRYFRKKGMVCAKTAMTGTAAVGIEGSTFHRWSGFRPTELTNENVQEEAHKFIEFFKKLPSDNRLVVNWRTTQVLIIDEISMMHRCLFDFFCLVAAAIRKDQVTAERQEQWRAWICDDIRSTLCFHATMDFMPPPLPRLIAEYACGIVEVPAGGLQLILSGDFFQIPPVEKHPQKDARGNTLSSYCFASPKWSSCFSLPCHVEFTKGFRQPDPVFRARLNEMRKGIVSKESRSMLISRMHVKLDTADGILPAMLRSHRRTVDQINEDKLGELNTPIVEFKSVDLSMTDGTPVGRYITELDKLCPVSATLKLREHAQVMVVKNLSVEEEGICNGSQGIIVGFTKPPADSKQDPQLVKKAKTFRDAEWDVPSVAKSKSSPIVRFKNGDTFVIPIAKWDVKEGERTVASRFHVPLILAFSLSYHRVQGSTLEKADIEIGQNIFTWGLAYVALSRVRELKGLTISALNVDKIMAAPIVKRLDARIQNYRRQAQETIDRRQAWAAKLTMSVPNK